MREELDVSSVVIWIAVSGALTESQRASSPIQYFRYVPPSDARFLGDQYAFNVSDLISSEKLQMEFIEYLNKLREVLSIKVSADIPLGIVYGTPMKSYRSTTEFWSKISMVCDEVNFSVYSEEDET